MSLAPITLFCYNRPIHLANTLNSLKMNYLSSDSELFVFSDGPKNKADELRVQEVRNVLRNSSGFNSIKIFESKVNKGLAKSVIEGVSQILSEYEKIIVLEDDLVFVKTFLTFMNNSLDYFEKTDQVNSISGYKFPIKLPYNFNKDVFFAKRASSWGWGTWKSRWEKVDWEISNFSSLEKDKKFKSNFNAGGIDLYRMLKKQMYGEIDSWAIRWCYDHFVNNAYCVYPTKSLVNNIGTDNSGTHLKNTNKYNAKLVEDFNPTLEPFFINSSINKRMKYFFSKIFFLK